MVYSTEQFATGLRVAREAKGLSQRALGRLVDVPQSHISKIETGGVDLRLSSLVEIARALDLEVALVPRKNLSAVRAITRHGRSSIGGAATTVRLSKELKRLRNTAGRISRQHPARREVAQLARRVNDLAMLGIPDSAIDDVRRINRVLEAYATEPGNDMALNDALRQLQDLRNRVVHVRESEPGAETIRPAYSLEEDDHG